MRRYALAAVAGSVLAISVAGTAFASHCNVANKPDGAGNHTTVLIDVRTDTPTFFDASGNQIARPTGGFVDVYLDLDFNGVLSGGDQQVENDVFVIATHSLKPNAAQGLPAVLPAVQNGDPAGPGRGVDG